jgi:hypothetical protein
VPWSAPCCQYSVGHSRQVAGTLTTVLIQFAEQVKADGATPVVLVFPSKPEIEVARDSGPKHYQSLLQTLADQQIPLLDLNDALGQEAQTVPLQRLIRDHYQPRGNAVVAQTLAAQLPALTADTCQAEPASQGGAVALSATGRASASKGE